jgi:hypothetical protein
MGICEVEKGDIIIREKVFQGKEEESVLLFDRILISLSLHLVLGDVAFDSVCLHKIGKWQKRLVVNAGIANLTKQMNTGRREVWPGGARRSRKLREIAASVEPIR